jgi:hypothetical protein
LRSKAVADKLHKTIDLLEIEHANRNHSKDIEINQPEKSLTSRKTSPVNKKREGAKKGDFKFFDEQE